MTKKKKDDESPVINDTANYQQMLEEVETLVRDVASPRLDLDTMVNKIERGYDLIKAMRTKLDETKARVETLRVEFEGKEG